MIEHIKNWILIRLIIRRLKKDATKHHSKVSDYSQALINCAINNKSNPIVKDGYWFVGDVMSEFCKIKNIKDTRKNNINKWIRLSSWNKNLKFTEL